MIPRDSLQAGGPMLEDTRVDAELEDILTKLRTSIKIVGVGGGGANTIARLYNEGMGGCGRARAVPATRAAERASSTPCFSSFAWCFSGASAVCAWKRRSGASSAC